VKIRELSGEIEALRARLEQAETAAPKNDGGIDVMSKGEKAELLATLMKEQDQLSGDGFAAVKAASRRKSTVFMGASSVAATASFFPQLSCVNKDSMLSHAMTIPLLYMPFTIGRTMTNGEASNNFALDGMGISSRHCQFENERWAGGAVSVCVLAPEAKVFLNGEALAEGEVVALQHLDRLVLGPCRLVCLFLKRALTPVEQEAWTYDACFEEMNSSSSSALMSTARRTTVTALKAVENEHIAQANSIALEMGASVRFNAHLVIKFLKLSFFCFPSINLITGQTNPQTLNHTSLS
jgi:hypothetical protein